MHQNWTLDGAIKPNNSEIAEGSAKNNHRPETLNSKPMEALQEQGYIIFKTNTMAELAMYHHQTLCSPPKSTLL